MYEAGPSALLVVVETRQRDTEYLVRFSRELDHLARKSQLAFELGLVPLELLDLPIALVADGLATRRLRVEARFSRIPSKS